MSLLWAVIYGVFAAIVFICLRYVWELLPLRNITEKSIFITGCDSGFGYLLALRLLNRDMTVFAGCLTVKGGEELTKNSRGLPGRLEIVSLDVTNQTSVDKAKATVAEKLKGKGLWGLVNNAGIVGMNGIDCFTEVDDYQKVLDVNTLGVIRTTHAFSSLVKACRGRIVCVGSVVGRVPISGCGPYCVSKYALCGYTDLIRQELSAFSVRVILLEPGYFSTAQTDPAARKRMWADVWAKSSPETKREYGQAYFDETQAKMAEILATVTSSRTDWVVDAYEHALTAAYPRDRYHVGWDSICFFIPLSVCPTWLVDFASAMAQAYFKMPKPANAFK